MKVVSIERTRTAGLPVNASRSAQRLVGLLVLVASTGFLCRVDMTVVAPSLMAEFNLSQIRIGWVFSAFLIGYTAFQVPSGWLADRVSTRPLFLALTVGWCLLTAATAAVGWWKLAKVQGALLLLLALRFVLGVLAAPTYPASGRAVAVSVPLELQGRATGAVLASIGIGSAVTPVLIGFVSARWGWRPAILVAASLAALTAVVWWAGAPTGETREPADAPRTAHTGSDPIASPSPLRQRSFWFLVVSYTLEGYLGYVFVFWFYLYLVQVRHFDLLKAAWLTTLPWICSIAAVPFGGVVSDWAVKHWGPTWGRRVVPLASFSLSAAFLVLGARTDSAALAVWSLTLSTALLLATEAPFWATMNQLSGSHSGIGGGVMNFGSNVAGMFSPVTTPWLASRLGWGVALSLTALVALFGAALWMGVKIGAAPLQAEKGTDGL